MHSLALNVVTLQTIAARQRDLCLKAKTFRQEALYQVVVATDAQQPADAAIWQQMADAWMDAMQDAATAHDAASALLVSVADA